jgi:HK97 gp10 family phage protein
MYHDAGYYGNVNIRAESYFRAGDWSRVMAQIIPRVVAAVTSGTDAVYEESQVLVPVDTGNLHETALTRVSVEGDQVTGQVVYPADYAAYVEFGTGRRGSESAGAGPFSYSAHWPGMPAQPYLRPALDIARPAIRAAFADEGFNI